MDFATPGFVLDAIRQRLEHPVIGYTEPPEDLVAAIVNWAHRRFNWHIHPDWFVFYTSLVPGLNVAVRTIGEDHSATIICTPIYPPFLKLAEINRRRMLKSSLQIEDSWWVMDLDDISSKTSQNPDSSVLISNPQNPTGRVYTESELTNLAEACIRNNATIVSDEIHWGLVLDEDKQHLPLASIDEEIADNTITLISHTKSYNLAGLQSALAIIPNSDLRERFICAKSGWTSAVSPLAYAGATAAYNDETTWLPELQAYLRVNQDLLETCVHSLANLSMQHGEGTHLSWIDARQLPVKNPAKYFEAHGLGFSDGVEFDAPGFVRFNFAAPRSLIKQALERLSRASVCAPLATQ